MPQEVSGRRDLEQAAKQAIPPVDVTGLQDMHSPGASPATLGEGQVRILPQDAVPVATAEAISARPGLPPRVVDGGRDMRGRLACPTAVIRNRQPAGH